ncbi:MAG: NUDIX domain-containing protein [Acidimicrobiia bacterium]
MTNEHAIDAIPSATVVLIRDGAQGIESLMLHRSLELKFAPGAWVFPGGRCDPEELAEEPDAISASRRAAVREAAEESNLVVLPEDLVLLSRWTPPPTAPRRFSTFVFVGRAPEGDVVVDGSEIDRHAWWTPAAALAERDRGDFDLFPPTWVTLWRLSHHHRVADALAAFEAEPLEIFETRMAKGPEGPVALWHGDSGYETTDAALADVRHRLWMRPTGWYYERTS